MTDAKKDTGAKDKKDKDDKMYDVDKFASGTLDPAICGACRMEWIFMGMNIHDTIGFICAIFIHLIQQIFVIGLIIMFRLTIINSEMAGIDTARAQLLDFKTAVDNQTLSTANATSALVGLCDIGGSTQTYHPFLHIMMLFVWITIATPPIWNNLWRQWIIIIMPTSFEPDPDFADDHPGQPGDPPREDDGGEPQEQELELKKAGKEKKAKKVTLDSIGGKEETDDDPGKKDSKKEGRNITYMNHCVKALAIIVVCLPHLLTNLYWVWIGSKHIVHTGSVDMLIMKALALKAIATIDVALFKNFAGSNVQDYMKQGGFRISSEKKNTWNKLWDAWLGPTVKLILAIVIALIMYFSQPVIREVREICSNYLDAGNIKWTCPAVQIKGNTCGLGGTMGLLF